MSDGVIELYWIIVAGAVVWVALVAFYLTLPTSDAESKRKKRIVGWLVWPMSGGLIALGFFMIGGEVERRKEGKAILAPSPEVEKQPFHDTGLIQSPQDSEETKRIVKESQFHEYFKIYTAPKSFNRAGLAMYWVPAAQGGKEIEKIEGRAQRLLKQRWHYGPESKSEIFDFRYVRIYAPGDYAEVETRERWYLPLYRENGSRVMERNPYFGPYSVEYILRKIDGKWLVQESTTPRAK